MYVTVQPYCQQNINTRAVTILHTLHYAVASQYMDHMHTGLPPFGYIVKLPFVIRTAPLT